MGNYTPKAFQGFMQNPDQDRAAAVKTLTEAVGGTFESFSLSIRFNYVLGESIATANSDRTVLTETQGTSTPRYNSPKQ